MSTSATWLRCDILAVIFERVRRKFERILVRIGEDDSFSSTSLIVHLREKELFLIADLVWCFCPIPSLLSFNI